MKNYINIYQRYHSVCPLVELGPPTHAPASEYVPPGTKGGDTLACE
jgi:hypothetical protein